jgi:multiple sugar transport system substrate-binding protein
VRLGRRGTIRCAQAALAAITVLLLAGCGSAKTTITFVFMRTSVHTQPYWQSVIKDFEAQNPTVHVNLKVYDWSVGPAKIAQMVKQGHPPEIARVATTSIPQYVASGWIDPLDAQMTPEFRAQFIPTLIDQAAQYQGRTFGLPITTSTRALYYNKALFARAGIASPPTSWDELRADAVKISQLGGGVHGFGLQGAGPDIDVYYYYFLLGNGGQVLAPDGIRAAFDTPAGVQALGFLQSLQQAGATEPDPTTQTRTNLESDFLAGRYGMILTATKLANQLDKSKPFDYGLAPIPYNTQPATIGVVDSLVLFSHGGNKAAAWSFIQFLYQEKYRVRYALTEGVLPETIAAANDPAFASNATMKFFEDQIPRAQFVPLSEQGDLISKTVGRAATAVYAGQKPPDAALKQAAAAVNQALSYAASAW